MAEMVSLSVTVYGQVQGVFFRVFVQNRAQELGLVGYTRNLPGGRSVEVLAEGGIQRLEELLEHLKKGPAGSRVENVKIKWLNYTDAFKDFQIR